MLKNVYDNDDDILGKLSIMGQPTHGFWRWRPLNSKLWLSVAEWL